ncbi:hypothetical protein [uncultured Alcanivorax sp.]|jgi:hypothetical protein|uniref:hypothetical protein n=1 Tax=uncultured Alcanivorax sp. TaxID=191215 RepID=UPI00261EEEB2|nr:hypothetical protein [uncultured Alcanivorax sp.]
MKSLGLTFRILLIVFFWLVATGELLKGYWYLAGLAAFLGVWVIAMPDHYRRGRKKLAWSIVVAGGVVMIALLQWRGVRFRAKKARGGVSRFGLHF